MKGDVGGRDGREEVMCGGRRDVKEEEREEELGGGDMGGIVENLGLGENRDRENVKPRK